MWRRGGGLFRSRAGAFLLEDVLNVEEGACYVSEPVHRRLAGGAFHSQRVDSVGGGAFLN